MKKLLSLVLTLVLCLGLAAPAMADDIPTVEEATSNLSFRADKIITDIQADPQIMVPMRVQATAGSEFGGSMTMTWYGYNLISTDTVFTIEHTGEPDDGSVFRVYWEVFVPYEGGIPGYSNYGQRIPNYFLTKDGFVDGDQDPDEAGGLLEIHPGESVRFHMPTDKGIGDVDTNMYGVTVMIDYPEYGISYFDIHLFKVDEASIAEKYPPIQFTDVPEGEWYTEPVEWAVRNEITNGTDAERQLFSPDSDCTNAQILTFLWRAAGSPEPAISNPFTNIDESKYYYKPALWAYEKGMVEGDIFEIDTPCTRASSVKYIWQAAGSLKAAEKASFEDVPADADYADAVDWALEAGVTTGSNAEQTMFSPDTVCTRAHIVTFLYRAFAE